MPRRPAIGILAALLLIPQLLGASEFGCSRHNEGDKPVASATEPMSGHEHHHESSGQSTTPREQHVPSDCCPAMSTCASGAAIQVADSDLTNGSWDNDAPADLVTFSRSRVESPDPPPPKA